jgi:hypothetical protein
VRVPQILRTKELQNFLETERGQFFYEKNRETDKVEGFADDGTVMAQATPEAIEAIHEILSNFERLSGLSCNVNKSMILPVGFGNNEIPEFLNRCGFPVVDTVTILGVKIQSDYRGIYNNFDERLDKIKKIRNFWSRYRLSLPGRLLVAKTFMLSQIGYLGCIIKPTKPQLKNFSEVINNFVKGSLNVSKDRLAMSPGEGGVGSGGHRCGPLPYRTPGRMVQKN